MFELITKHLYLENSNRLADFRASTFGGDGAKGANPDAKPRGMNLYDKKEPEKKKKNCKC